MPVNNPTNSQQALGTADSVQHGNMTLANGGALRTGTTAADTALIQAYDNNTGPAYVTFATLTAGNTPTMDLSDSVTKAGGYIYRAGGTDIPLADGGTNASLVADNGGIFYSTATAAAILPSTSTANQPLLSGASGAPGWSTATYPGSTTANQILYSSSNNVVGQLASANNGTLVTDSSGVPSILAGPGATGRVLQSNAAAAPSFSTATYPSTATGTGTILRADGTNWAPTTATYPNTTTANQLLVSTATNVVGEVTAGTTGQVLTGVTGAVPAFSATPTLTSVTFGAGTALSVYQEGSFTPTVSGGSTAGTTTYVIQQGTYVRIGSVVFINLYVSYSAATGTGELRISGLPFTVGQGDFNCGTVQFDSAGSAWPAGRTNACVQFNYTTTRMNIRCTGTGVAAASMQMTNTAAVIIVSGHYRV